MISSITLYILSLLLVTKIFLRINHISAGCVVPSGCSADRGSELVRVVVSPPSSELIPHACPPDTPSAGNCRRVITTITEKASPSWLLRWWSVSAAPTRAGSLLLRRCCCTGVSTQSSPHLAVDSLSTATPVRLWPPPWVLHAQKSGWGFGGASLHPWPDSYGPGSQPAQESAARWTGTSLPVGTAWRHDPHRHQPAFPLCVGSLDNRRSPPPVVRVMKTHVAIDDATWLAYVEVLPDEK